MAWDRSAVHLDGGQVVVGGLPRRLIRLGDISTVRRIYEEVPDIFMLQNGLPAVTLARAKELAPFGANRELYAEQKERLFGENAVLDGPHGPAHMLKHSTDFR